MATYNAARFLPDSILSIANQTWRDYEFIILDDSSTDQSQSILREAAQKDTRIKLLRNVSNRGLTYSLNRCLGVVSGKFIARMDADDVAAPNRLAKQLDCFARDPNLVICGTNIMYTQFDLTPISQSFFPLDDWDIRCYCLFDNPFSHTTVMFPKYLVNEARLRYNEEFYVGQDYELWTRILDYGTATNLAKPLSLVRIHPNASSTRYREQQRHSGRLIRDNYRLRFFSSTKSDPEHFEQANYFRESELAIQSDTATVQVENCYQNLSLLQNLKRLFPDRDCSFLSGYLAYKCIKPIWRSIFTTYIFSNARHLCRLFPHLFPITVVFAIKRLVFRFRTGGFPGLRCLTLSRKERQFLFPE